MSIAIRADASTNMGVGHIMRCLSLADALAQQGATLCFVSRDFSGHLADLIRQRGYEVCLLPKPETAYQPSAGEPAHASWLAVPWQQDAEETLIALDGTNANKIDWLIVDHYGIDRRWHHKLRNDVQKIMVIDDLADRSSACDLLLDQTCGRTEEAYRPYVSERCQLLLGSQFALLRPEFLALRPKAIAKRKGTKGIKRILLTMGGVDEKNITDFVLSALEPLARFEPSLIIDVVLGVHAPHLEMITAQAVKHALDVNVHAEVSNMAELMLEADLAIGAAGSTTWERCCLGLPSVLMVTADNQQLVAENLTAAGAIRYIGVWGEITAHDVSENCLRLMEDTVLYQSMVELALAVCDGNGVSRVKEALANYTEYA